MPPQTNSGALTFDSAPVTQDTPVSSLSKQPSAQPNPSPADNGGLTFDSAPVSQDTPASALSSFQTPSGNTFAPGQQVQHSSGATGTITGQHPDTQQAMVQWNQNHPGQQYGVEGTIRANDPQNTGTAVARWAEQVANDVKYGTDFTGIGKVLKKMGAHGVDVGNSEGVADWMASIPLGLLRTGKGLAEAAGSQSAGGNWQAAKDMVGGIGQTAEMPTAVIAPENAELEELAGQAVDHATGAARAATSAAGDTVRTGANAVGRGVKAVVKAPGKLAEKTVPGIYPPEVKLPTPAEARQATQPIFDTLHQQVRDAVGAVAKDAGVAVKDSDSIQDVAMNAAKALKAKASKYYSQIDDALTAMSDTGEDMQGRYQAIDENISKLKKKVADLIGEPEKQQQMQEALDAENAKKQAVMNKLKEAGLEHLPDKASALHRQASAMEDFGAKVQQNTNGLPGHPDVPERLNPHTFANSLKNLKNSTDFGGNRLKQALGDYAEPLIQQTNDAKSALLKMRDNAAAQATQAGEVAVKRARVKGAALTAAGLEGAHKLYNLFSGE